MFSCIFSCFKPTIVIEKPPNPTDIFISQQKEKFKKLQREQLNSNIEPEFYDAEKYNNIIKEADNVLETQWRTRIMSKNTPRGPIYMHYDAYKQGFAYYCSENLSYRIVNSIAIDYVKTYHCYDFFVDENYFDDEYNHPLLEVHNPKQKTVNDPSNNKIPNVKQGPFIQRKRNQSKELKKDTDDVSKNNNATDKEQSEKPQKTQKPKHQNKFIYLGHPRNINFIKKPKTKINTFESPLMNSMKQLSWAEYKKQQNT